MRVQYQEAECMKTSKSLPSYWTIWSPFLSIALTMSSSISVAFFRAGIRSANEILPWSHRTSYDDQFEQGPSSIHFYRARPYSGGQASSIKPQCVRLASSGSPVNPSLINLSLLQTAHVCFIIDLKINHRRQGASCHRSDLVGMLLVVRLRFVAWETLGSRAQDCDKSWTQVLRCVRAKTKLRSRSYCAP